MIALQEVKRQLLRFLHFEDMTQDLNNRCLPVVTQNAWPTGDFCTTGHVTALVECAVTSAMVSVGRLPPAENVSPVAGNGAVRRRTSSGFPRANGPIDLVVLVDHRARHPARRRLLAASHCSVRHRQRLKPARAGRSPP